MAQSRLHILMLIDAWFPRQGTKVGVYGGGQVHVRELRAALVEKHPCRVELMYPAHPNLLIRAFWSFYVIFRILTYARHHRLDLIHSHGFNSGFPAKVSAKLLGIPVVHTVHGSHLTDQGASGPRAWLEKWLLTQIKYDRQISVATKFTQYQNVNQDITVIPNGVNIAAFNAVNVKKYDNPSLIWVGRTDKVKGLDLLKKAVIKVRKKIPRLKTNLVTGGRLSGKNLIRAYKRAHVFVLPSLAEGQPITLLEAWAAKLPVVVTAVGDNPLMVKDGINGYLVEPGNIRQLSDAIIRVLRAPVTSRKMGLAGYDLVKRTYTWTQVARQTYVVYQQVIATFAQTHTVSKISVPSIVHGMLKTKQRRSHAPLKNPA